MKLQFSTIAAAAVLSLSSAVAWAHFGIVIPEHSAVLEQKDANVHFTIAFAHPMERNGMTMAKPDAFYVVQDGRKTDLSGSLKADKLFEKASWQADYRFARPGVYQFVVEPKPYWEPAEDKFIVHYTKVIVPAYGDEDGWDKPAGVKTEIVSHGLSPTMPAILSAVSFWLTASPRQGLTSRWSTLIATANTRLPMTTLSLRS